MDDAAIKKRIRQIMVVEDHEPSLRITASFLKSLGYEVVTAINGADALEKIKQDMPDLIVSDVLMPVMDGYNLCRELKNDDEFNKIPVIFISSTYIDPHDMELGLSAGAEAYIIKSSEAGDFMAKLRKVIEICGSGGYKARSGNHQDEKFMENYHEILTRKLRDKIEEVEKTNKQLFESEKKFRLVMENIEDVFWMKNPEITKVYYISPGYERLWKRKSKTLIDFPFSFSEIIHPGDIKGYLNIIETYHKKGRSYECEYRIIPQKGEEYWIHERGFPVVDEINNSVMMVGVCADITGRKMADYKLQAAHEMFLTVLDAIDLTIFVADLNTHEILFMNKCMKELLGGDFTGESCWKVLMKNEGPCAECSDSKLLDKENNPTGVNVSEGVHSITGRLNIFHDSAIRWVDGRLVHLQIATDITDYKEMEAKQLEYERYLQKTQKTEAIGTLAGGIAHDFNNILSPLMGYTELLKANTPQESRNNKYIDEVMHAALRARDLVGQILTFSRQEGQEVKPIKIQPLITEALKLLRASIPTTIDMKQELDPCCGLVNADPTKIHQIIMNLVTNAYHAMETRGGQLRISLEQVSLKERLVSFTELLPGDYALLKVSDTGTGIDREILSRIFDPYFTTKGLGKGTGLGLSVVLGIVKNFKGDIHITSSPGKGTTILVYLPVVEKMDKEKGIEKGEPIKGGDERIILVDDDPAVVEIGRKILERLGYKVTPCVGSLSAIDVFMDNPESFDLLVTDMTMPKMTGVELANEIRKINPEIPVVICTGYSEQISMGKSRELGIQELVMKPIQTRAFARAVRAALGVKP